MLPKLLGEGALVIDTRRATEYSTGHVPGTINIPFNSAFTTWAGWLVPYGVDFYVLADERRTGAVDAVVRDLAMIGLDRAAGYFDTVALDAWVIAGRPLGAIPQLESRDLAASLEHHGVTLIDVRNAVEWGTGHIDSARHIPLGYLTDRLERDPREKTLVVQCQSGSRSAIAASLLRDDDRSRQQLPRRHVRLGQARTAGRHRWPRNALPLRPPRRHSASARSCVTCSCARDPTAQRPSRAKRRGRTSSSG
jgi:hydroxyacylglutathione hydrolase